MQTPSFFKVALVSFILLNTSAYSQASDDDLMRDSSCGVSSQTAELIAMINAARSGTQYCGSAKLKASEPLTLSCNLQRSAQGHANTLEKENRLSHVGKGGSKLGARVTSSGYMWSAVGENVAKGQTTASGLLEDWLGSKKHCKNLLKANYQEIGVARAGLYWVAVFATPR